MTLQPLLKAGILFSSEQDRVLLDGVIETLGRLGRPYASILGSMRLNPRGILEWAETAEANQFGVLIVIANTEPGLPEFVAAATRLPVIALLTANAFDALWSSSLHSPCLATAAVAYAMPDCPDQAAMMALRILAVAQPSTASMIDAYRQIFIEESPMDLSANDDLVSGIKEISNQEPFSDSSQLTPQDFTNNQEEEDNLEVEQGEQSNLASKIHSAPIEEDERIDNQEDISETFPPPPPEPSMPEPPKPIFVVAPKPKAPSTPAIAFTHEEILSLALKSEEPAAPHQESLDDFTEEYADSDLGPVSIRSINLDRPLTGEPIMSGRKPTLPIHRASIHRYGRVRINPDDPDIETIENAVDCLLEGGIIAFPTETVYGLAVDGTNPDAVERLYALKGRERQKPVTVMIDSSRMLAGIVCNLTTETRRLMEAFWPGPLTLIFSKRPGNFTHIHTQDTIGVRMPDHSIPLAIIQALGRPLACTSANLSGQPDAIRAEAVDALFGPKIEMILDGGRVIGGTPSTVIDVTNDPYHVLRVGGITPEQIAEATGARFI